MLYFLYLEKLIFISSKWNASIVMQNCLMHTYFEGRKKEGYLFLAEHFHSLG